MFCCNFEFFESYRTKTFKSYYRSVISRVLRATEEETSAIGEIDQAYEVVKEVDCLDTSKEGNLLRSISRFLDGIPMEYIDMKNSL